MKCVFCFLRRNKKNSVKCQFCDNFLEKSRELKNGLAYLESGFANIEAELDGLETKVKALTGILFKRHTYRAEDLLDSAQMDRVQSLAGKIKDDVQHWEAAGNFPLRLRMLYNEKAEETHERVRELNRMIQERKPTLWEQVGGFFRRLYRFVVEALPLFIRGTLRCTKRGLLNAA